MISAKDHTEMIQVPKALYLKLVQEHEQMTARLLVLEQQLANLQRLHFGRKSERFTEEVSSQEIKPKETPVKEVAEEEEALIDFLSPVKKGKAAKKGHARSPLPKDIPRVEEVIQPAEDVTGWKIIGQEVTQILERVPEQIYVRKIIRYKYLSPDGTRIVIATLPTLPLYRSHIGAGLLSDLIVGKYEDHAPLNRQAGIYKRQGVILPTSSINGWITKAGDEIEVVYNSLLKKAFSGDYIQMDETGMNVMTEEHPGSTFNGTFWAVHAPQQGVALFKYDKSHGAQVPKDLLESFHGTVQSDGLNVYKFLDTPPWNERITTLGCWAHCRRHIENALKNEPLKVPKILSAIQKLYQVERIARGKSFSPEQTRVLRQRFSVLILDQLYTCLKNEEDHLEAPASNYGKAVKYAMKNWDRLTNYTQNGNWNIDNNPIENVIRRVAMGRHNFLFTGNHEAAQRSAMMYSFMATCKIHGVNPQKWLEWVLIKLPDCKMSEIDSLLPANYKASLAEGPPLPDQPTGWVSTSA
jgi:transposase